jgi:hypothetical protein
MEPVVDLTDKEPEAVAVQDSTKPIVVGSTKCEQANNAVLDWYSGQSSFVSDPIEIVKRDGKNVTFKVKQTWKSWGSVSWIATDFTNATTSEAVCDKTMNAEFKTESPEYTAVCNNGVASVDVYVRDSSYSRWSDNASVPGRCDPSGSGRMRGYYFTVPCTPTCAETVVSTN